MIVVEPLVIALDELPLILILLWRNVATMTMFTWDQAKRRENLRKHGIDFVDIPVLFEGFTLTAEDDRQAYGEQRFVTLGLLHGVVVAVVHTERRGALRIISARKATRHEVHSFFRQVSD